MPRLLVDTNIVISGIFFHGNENVLTEAIIRGDVRAVVPEYVYAEVETVIARDFSTHRALQQARIALVALLAKVEWLSESEAQSHEEHARRLVRDPKDVQVVAAAFASGIDILVSGDDDLHELTGEVPFEVLRTREALARLRIAPARPPKGS